jgi:ketosteroid isomerase-like protein
VQRIIKLAMLAVLVGSAQGVVAQAPAGLDAVLGTWDVVTKTPMRDVLSTMVFAVESGQLTASDSLLGPANEVSFADGVIGFMLEANGQRYRVEAEIKGDALGGKMILLGASFSNVDEMYRLTGTRRAPVEDDRAAIAEVINRWAETAAAKDLDAMMTVFSSSYRDDILDSKARMREYWKLAIESGMTEGMRVRFNPEEITVKGDTAKTGRVYYQAKPGGYYQVMELKKEPDGVWRIVNSYS